MVSFTMCAELKLSLQRKNLTFWTNFKIRFKLTHTDAQNYIKQYCFAPLNALNYLR